MNILILTGPPGVGKNTISHILAKMRSKCAVIDVDMVRWMVLQPHHAPWSGEAGKKQVKLGIRNACMLGENFTAEGYDVVILDVVGKQTIQLYKKYLQGENLKVAVLLPTLEETHRRNMTRPERISKERIETLYSEQSDFQEYDEKIDNTYLTAKEAAEKLNKLF